MKNQDYGTLTNELYAQLTALHYMGLSRHSFSTYCRYGEQVTNYILEHRLDIIGYIDTWVDNQWNTAESIWSTFFEYFNEGEEIEALRVLSIGGFIS